MQGALRCPRILHALSPKHELMRIGLFDPLVILLELVNQLSRQRYRPVWGHFGAGPQNDRTLTVNKLHRSLRPTAHGGR